MRTVAIEHEAKSAWTEHIDVYQFDELADSIQEKILHQRAEWNTDYDWWEYVVDDFVEIAKRMGITIRRSNPNDKRTTPAVFFSVAGCQGDGACFEGFYSYRKDCVNLVKQYAPQDTELHRIIKGLANIQKHHKYGLTADITHRGYYSHSGCTEIEVRGADGWLVDNDDDVVRLLRDLMDWLYDMLREEFANLRSREYILEQINDMGEEFTKYGDVWND